MYKFGLEQEFFVALKSEPTKIVLVPDGVSHDSCGWLAEVRGEPCTDFTGAVFSLGSAADKLTRQLNKKNYLVLDAPVMVVPRELRHNASRIYEKGLTKYHNLCGFANHRIKGLEATAGIHISVTYSTPFYYDTYRKCEFGEAYHRTTQEKTYNCLWDWARLFRLLDYQFRDQIRAAKRNPGFYEIKEDGRIEYRSLPTNISIKDLISGWEKAWQDFKDDKEAPR